MRIWSSLKLSVRRYASHAARTTKTTSPKTGAVSKRMRRLRGFISAMRGRSNALVQLQARYNHCGDAASEECLSAATFVKGCPYRRSGPAEPTEPL